MGHHQSNDRVAEAALRHRELFNAGDREAWLANLVETPYLEEPVGSGRRHGRDHFAQMFDAVHSAAAPRAIPPFDDVVVSGTEAAVYLAGRPMDNVETGIVEIFEVAPDGRVAGVRVFIDPRRLPGGGEPRL